MLEQEMKDRIFSLSITFGSSIWYLVAKLYFAARHWKAKKKKKIVQITSSALHIQPSYLVWVTEFLARHIAARARPHFQDSFAANFGHQAKSWLTEYAEWCVKPPDCTLKRIDGICLSFASFSILHPETQMRCQPTWDVAECNTVRKTEKQDRRMICSSSLVIFMRGLFETEIHFHLT